MTELELAIIKFDGNNKEEYADLIVESLRKQIPMKMQIVNTVLSICPTCKFTRVLIEDNYCRNCGQHLNQK